MRKVYSRVAAILVFVAFTSQVAAAPARERELPTLKTYVKRLITKCFDMLGTPPG